MYETAVEEIVEASDESRVRPLFGKAEGVDLRAAVANGFTYRHAWSSQHNGRVNLRVTGFFGIRPDWNVFVSAGQAVVHGDATAGMFIGAARFTVNNVAPESDAMRIQLTIEWDAPLSVITDYLVVPF